MGTYAGQVVMRGFIDRQIPVVVRRTVTMLPALIILAVGISPTDALVLSQVVLSFGIPFAVLPLVVLTGRRDVMGAQVNGPLTSAVAYLIAAAITGMNVFLIVSSSPARGTDHQGLAARRAPLSVRSGADGLARAAVHRHRGVPA